MEEVFKHRNLFKTEKLLKIWSINIIRNNIIIKHTTLPIAFSAFIYI